LLPARASSCGTQLHASEKASWLNTSDRPPGRLLSYSEAIDPYGLSRATGRCGSGTRLNVASEVSVCDTLDLWSALQLIQRAVSWPRWEGGSGRCSCGTPRHRSPS